MLINNVINILRYVVLMGLAITFMSITDPLENPALFYLSICFYVASIAVTLGAFSLWVIEVKDGS